MRHDHNSDIDVLFYNDRILQVIPKSDIEEPFTYIPIKAGHMELVNGNAIIFGNMTEGYGNVSVDVDVELTCEALDSGGYSEITFPIQGHRVVRDTDGGGFYDIYHLIATLPATVYTGSTYSITVQGKTGSYTALPGDTLKDIRDELSNNLALNGVSIVACTVLADNKICMYRQKIYWELSDTDPKTTNPYLTWVVSGVIAIDTYVKKFPQLKRGSKHGYGIVYKDECGRQNSVGKGNEMDINIPFYSEPVYGDAIGDYWIDCGLNGVIVPIFKIYNKPPIWATTYEVVYCGNLSMDKWLQVRAEAIAPLGNHRFSMDAHTTIDYTVTKNERWKVAPWVWDNGDRLRLIGTIDPATGVLTRYTTLYDYEIESVDTDDKFLFQAVNRPATFDGAINILIEVYRPKKGLGLEGASGISVFYGSGMAFEVGVDAFGNKYHKGDVDQDVDANGNVLTPAEVTNKAFDSWKFWRLNYNSGTTVIKPFYAESNLPSDWWEKQILINQITSKGFPFLYDISQKQSVLGKRFRWGGYLLTGTQVNNIAHFTYADFKDLAEKDGDITGLREIGFTVKAIQWHKETSIYINRIQNFNADGTPDFTLTDAFIGLIRPMETNYGCQHPDSVLVNSRNLYYWDNIEGKLIRSAPNGQIAISGPEYKMNRWFKDLGKWIIANGGSQKLNVRLGFNVEHNELWCSFRIDDEVYGVIFSESKGRWISRLNQVTDAYVHAGEFFAHLYLQKLWIMNLDEGQDWLTWSGVPTYAEIEVVSNIEPGKNKVFNAIAQFVDHLLSSLSKYFNIPREASASGELMESNVSVWERREGTYFGEILKDENTPGNFVNLNDRKMNGQEMRGRYAFAKFMTEEHSEKVRIDSIVIFSTPSERNV
jgi:hypothetical protein